MIKDIFKKVCVNLEKLKSYGFTESEKGFSYSVPICEGQFNFLVTVSREGEVSAKVIDAISSDEYFLHLVENSTGEFVGKVRAEYERVLIDVRDKCFDTEIFKCGQTQLVIDYVRECYGDEPEYLWEKFPTDAVWRRKDNKKWYGIIMTVKRNKLGLSGDDDAEILDLRISPDEIEKVVDDTHFFRGYHMNKKSWFTICLNEGVPTETITDFIDASYCLALKK